MQWLLRHYFFLFLQCRQHLPGPLILLTTVSFALSVHQRYTPKGMWHLHFPEHKVDHLVCYSMMGHNLRSQKQNIFVMICDYYMKTYFEKATNEVHHFLWGVTAMWMLAPKLASFRKIGRGTLGRGAVQARLFSCTSSTIKKGGRTLNYMWMELRIKGATFSRYSSFGKGKYVWLNETVY